MVEMQAPAVLAVGKGAQGVTHLTVNVTHSNLEISRPQQLAPAVVGVGALRDLVGNLVLPVGVGLAQSTPALAELLVIPLMRLNQLDRGGIVAAGLAVKQNATR